MSSHLHINVTWGDCLNAITPVASSTRLGTKIARGNGLQNLNLSGTNVTDEGLRKLAVHPQLNSIDLKRSQITDEGLRILGTLPALASLELDETQVMGAGLDGFPKSAPLT